MKSILVATDGSANALKAAEFAGELAARLKSELHVLAVAYRDRARELELREFAEAEHLDGGLLDAAIKMATANSEQAKRQAESKGAKTVKASVAEGDAVERILEYINANKIQSVVVGRRGKGTLERLLLGSVSQKLAALAPCIVIICPQTIAAN